GGGCRRGGAVRADRVSRRPGLPDGAGLLVQPAPAGGRVAVTVRWHAQCRRPLGPAARETDVAQLRGGAAGAGLSWAGARSQTARRGTLAPRGGQPSVDLMIQELSGYPPDHSEGG